MPLFVQKFGGTSVGDLEKIKKVADKIIQFKNKNHEVVVVLSAMSGKTDALIEKSKVLCESPCKSDMDVLLSIGEQEAIALLSIRLNSLGYPSKTFLGFQVPIVTDNVYGKARIKSIKTEAILECLKQGQIPIVAGFQGCDDEGRITTLGRGGSDTTAVALAAALNADECQIFTDVEGVYTTDPRVVDEARLLDTITFEEMLEMASLGSKVLQIRSVEFAGKYNVTLRVQHAFKEGKGTKITMESKDLQQENMEAPVVSGIAFNRCEAKLTIRGVPHVPGIALAILSPISEANIDVDMIVQNIGVQDKTDFTFTVDRKDYDRAIALIEQIAKKLNASSFEGDNRIAKVSVVGVGMRSHAGVATKIFKCMAKEGINLEIISTSEIKVSIVIAERYLELAVRSLHAAFELHNPPQEMLSTT